MRAALLLSVKFMIFGVVALFGMSAVVAFGKPVLSVAGFATALVYAAIPPLIVLGRRK